MRIAVVIGSTAVVIERFGELTPTWRTDSRLIPRRRLQRWLRSRAVCRAFCVAGYSLAWELLNTGDDIVATGERPVVTGPANKRLIKEENT